ncbi:MarR family transcriptional regulator [Nostoc sp. 3335mG]|nr:MarR family transcriptional regulator [Nostoc sp. 3335mG]
MVGDATPENAARARRLIAMKERIAGLYPVKVTDPVYDALFHLYIAEAEGRPMAVSAVAPLIRVPSTTWLRWVALMEEAGLIVRQPDPADGRRSWITLSRECKMRLDELIADLW